jgi:hypothetical protein
VNQANHRDDRDSDASRRPAVAAIATDEEEVSTKSNGVWRRVVEYGCDNHEYDGHEAARMFVDSLKVVLLAARPRNTETKLEPAEVTAKSIKTTCSTAVSRELVRSLYFPTGQSMRYHPTVPTLLKT